MSDGHTPPNMSNFIRDAKTTLTRLLFRGWKAGPDSYTLKCYDDLLRAFGQGPVHSVPGELMTPCSEASVDAVNTARRMTGVIVTAHDDGDRDLDRAGLSLDTRGRLAPTARATVVRL